MLVTVAHAQETRQVLSPGDSQSVTPLLTPSQVFDLMIAAVIGSLGTIGLILGAERILMIFVPSQRLNEVQNRRYSADSIAIILPLVIQGITVILVVLAVMLLGVLRIISAEGTLGILGSIVGYVLGKVSQKGSLERVSEETTT